MALEAADIRAAVTAGVVTEAQAARLISLSEERAGVREALAVDDEPFELYRGFSDVFVALGIALLGVGVVALGVVASGSVTGAMFVGLPLAWVLAEYFGRRRRMILPSLVLALGWCGGFAWTLSDIGAEMASAPLSGAALGGLAGALLFYARFHVPFALFLAAMSAFGGLLLLAGVIDPEGLEAASRSGPSALFDLRRAGAAGLATLVFGVGAFALAMRYDLSDPHRVSRRSVAAFWLHLAAAPAIVNTVMMTLLNAASLLAFAALALTICAIAAVALIIDRRSFLLSAMIYLGSLLLLAAEALDDHIAVSLALLSLGALITGLGAGWTRLRAALMRALPPFPYKDRLPPAA